MGYTFRDLVGQKVLITGDVGAGKTKLTIALLDEAVAAGWGAQITVIDMAPATVFIHGRKIGGKLIELSDQVKQVRYLTPPRVETPRLSAKSTEELLRLVAVNEARIRPLLTAFVETPTPVLFVNDISIYLQSGDETPILAAMEAAETFIANGYYGTTLTSDFATEVSTTERRLMQQLMDAVDRVIAL